MNFAAAALSYTHAGGDRKIPRAFPVAA